MKKNLFLSLVLAVILMIPCMFLMTACGNNGGDGDPRFANAIAIDKSFSADDDFTHSEKIVNINTTDTYCFTFTKETDADVRYIFGFAGYREDGFAQGLDIVDEESCELYKSTDTSNKIDITDTYKAVDGVFYFEEDKTLENGTYYLLVKFTTVPDGVLAPDGIMAVVGIPS